MESSLVLTVIGPDRPGIVQRVSDVVAAHGGSWQESRMAHLAGQFAGILRVALPHGQVSALSSALGALEGDGLRVLVADGADDAPTVQPTRLVLDVMGQDRPGIVQAIASAVAARGLNVLELESEVLSAPMSGDAMFKAAAELAMPAGLDLDAVRRELEDLAVDLQVDLRVDEG